jgi:division/cell wall cluster transcriptional repressor MraZ
LLDFRDFHAYYLVADGTKREKMGNLLLGSGTARLDKSGRLKIPEKFRVAIEERYGKDVFVTSLNNEAIHIFPLPIWLKLTGITQEGTIQFKPSVQNLLIRVSRMGSISQIDPKGRVLISPHLRQKARLDGEVEVLGINDTHLQVWNKEILDKTIEAKPLTDEDWESIARLSSRGRDE